MSIKVDIERQYPRVSSDTLETHKDQHDETNLNLHTSQGGIRPEEMSPSKEEKTV